MFLNGLDWSIVGVVLLVSLIIGFWAMRKSGKNTTEYFLSGKSMPWWLLGMSMVATTFSTDTPLLVTDITRVNGVGGNWVWWAGALTGMLTVFVYARLWRKSNVNTDMEFYEMRYFGLPGKAIRIFRSFYLGFVFNSFAIAGVCLAAIKIGNIMLGLNAFQTIGIAASVTLLFSTLGGFRGVLYTDFLLFFIAMTGAIAAAVIIVELPEVGGFSGLFEKVSSDKIAFFPESTTLEPTESNQNVNPFFTILLIPIAIQWWNVWYPGAEPGGGGYIAQRMLAAKDEKHAIRATLLFNIMHYAVRPWPWMIVALASLIVFPDLASIQKMFPDVDPELIKDDMAYPAMLSYLPHGLLGLIVASLLSAFMSTISTHLNWGASYLVNDFLKPIGFGQKNLSNEGSKATYDEKQLVWAGRIINILILITGTSVALFFESAQQLFKFIIMFGAGTGLLFILRWFWWRINAWTEITAMIVSGIISMSLVLGNFAWVHDLEKMIPIDIDAIRLLIVIVVTTFCWLIVLLVTSKNPSKEEITHMLEFYKSVEPYRGGWKKIIKLSGEKLSEKSDQSLAIGILGTVVGSILVFSMLFGLGYAFYGMWEYSLYSLVTFIICVIIIIRIWKQVTFLFKS